MLLCGPGELRVPKGPEHQHPGGMQQLIHWACGEEQNFQMPPKRLIYNILWEGGGIFSRGFFQLKDAFSKKYFR